MGRVIDPSPTDAVITALEPMLVPAGFTAGQGGSEGVGQVIFCAAHDEFSERYPWLPQADAHERGLGGCVDLIVDVDRDGILRGADLEELTLEETLRRVGGAPAPAPLVGQPLDVALPRVAAVVQRLLAPPD